MLASFEAGGATALYSAPGSRWGASGSLVEGDVALDADSSVVRVMSPNRIAASAERPEPVGAGCGRSAGEHGNHGSGGVGPARARHYQE